MSKNKLFFRLVMCVVVNFYSCNYIMDVEDLGDNYYLDGNQIVLSNNKQSYNGSGIAVIPPNVIDYKILPEFKLIKSTNGINNKVYWIILTKQKAEELSYFNDDHLYNAYYKFKNVIGPIDSTKFLEITDSLEINTNFK